MPLSLLQGPSLGIFIVLLHLDLYPTVPFSGKPSYCKLTLLSAEFPVLLKEDCGITKRIPNATQHSLFFLSPKTP